MNAIIVPAALNTVIREGKPQLRTLAEHFKNGKTITQFEALLLYRIAALPRRIKDMEEYGVRFQKTLLKDETGRRYAKYAVVAE